MVQLIAARYELVEVLGRGGMGRVWLARDRTLGREVAVKEVALPPGLDEAQVERTYARTFREARSAARLDHPGIVTVHDVVEEDGRPWIVMRLVRAESLDKLIACEGPLPPQRVAAIGADLLDALRAAHTAGVVHRDVKPGNVLLPPDRAVLTDFGIATVAGDETLTQAGAIVGSPAYLAPEQARYQKATPASDLWSLGATLYAAVEGRPPYKRPDVWGVMAAVLSDDPDPLQLAGPLAPVLYGLLHKDPDRRMSPDEAGRLLRQIAQGPAAPLAPPPRFAPPHNLTLPPPPAAPTVPGTVPPHPPRPPRRVPWPLIVPAGVFAAALVIAIASIVIFTADGDDDPGTSASGRPPASGQASTSPRQIAPRPAGYRLHRGSAFVAAVPQGWQAEVSGDDLTLKDPTEGVVRGLAIQRLVSTAFPDPGNGLASALGKMKADTTQYPKFKEESFDRKIPYQGDMAAEAQFTFVRNDIPGRARVRVFRFDGAIYQIILMASQKDWNGAVPVYKTFLDTLRGTA
ncbi:serine/threonine protein kinase [Actinomadura pelletieri DSM 43383]|uniref:non-specific serine/threonine protein kinase n=1 Tax=Actinomadura pelletieri DSM 43383 TaxID=1120940 RepID=A0A495QI24_9ACTN|nr:serine/threonine-protein kinase [Actinomadura pelletieri]RKS71771.1 serine/threonine protein kinase [Actinomadura pelletieri DSM 43383]